MTNQPLLPHLTVRALRSTPIEVPPTFETLDKRVFGDTAVTLLRLRGSA